MLVSVMTNIASYDYSRQLRFIVLRFDLELCIESSVIHYVTFVVFNVITRE